jgi:probable F420-dependent oxidoreductase
VGVWLNNALTASTPAEIQRREVARIERLGFGSVWTGESPGGKDIFAKLGIWLAATERIVVGSGIANLWARPAVTMLAGANTLGEAYPGRFFLGIGAGHAYQAASLGEAYRPLDRMRGYLDDMDEALRLAGLPGAPTAPIPSIKVPRLLAAVGPNMLAVAGERVDGAHPFASPVETTVLAREILGPDKLLVPEQAVIFDTDRSRAREAARAYRAMSVNALKSTGAGPFASPYNRNLRRLGYSEEQITTVDDRVVDAIIAHGDETEIVKRVRTQLDAGADCVVIDPIAADLPAVVDQLEHLAPALLEITA